MKYVGAHVSIEGGVFNAPLRAKKIGAKAFACFTKNQKRWASKPYTEEDIFKFKDNLKTSGILPSHILAHSSYLINLGHYDEKARAQSIDALIDEAKRCEWLGIEKIVVHPGSHLKAISETACLNYIAASINVVIAATNKVVVVVENTAGQGGNVGYRFEHLAHLINEVHDKSRVGVCIDTCHLFASGYEFRTEKKFAEVWQKFTDIVGFSYLKGMHLNDSKSVLGSLVDRHESLGKGEIGLQPFEFLMKDKRFDNLPLILETVDPLAWDKEIKLLYSFML